MKMSNILKFLKTSYPNAKGTLKDVSDGLCDLNAEAIKIDMLKRREVNKKISADNISTPDTIGIFKGKVVFIEFKDANEDFLKSKEKRLSLFLKQVDVLVLLYLLNDKLLKTFCNSGMSFWMVYRKESCRRAIKRHFQIYGMDKRYTFLYRKVLPVSIDNFLKFLESGKLKL